MNKEILAQIEERLKCPTITLKRFSNNTNVPKIFVEASLHELNQVKMLLYKMKTENIKK